MDRRLLVLAGRIMRITGLCFMVASCLGGLLLRASAAIPISWPHFRFPHLSLGVVSVASPSPGPKATGGPTTVRGGPVTLSVSGNVTLGQRISNGSAAVSGGESTGNAGLLLSLGRRTATTSLRFTVPAGVTGRFSTLGQPQAEFSTPHFALAYASQSISALGALSLGTTIRGVSLVLPLKNGDVAFYGGPAFGSGGQLLRVQGIRARTLIRGQLVELGYSKALAPDASASIESLIFGIAASTQKISSLFEAALQQSSIEGKPKSPRRLSYVLRADYGGGESYASLTLRHIADSFAAVGGGPLQSEDFASLGLRRSSGANSWSIDESLGRTGSPNSEGGAQSIRRGTLSFGHTFLRNGAQTQLTMVDQRAASDAGITWSGGVGLDAGFVVRNTSALVIVNAQRNTASNGPPVSTMQYALRMQRPFGRAFLNGGYQFSRQTTFGTVTSNTVIEAGLSKNLGRTGVMIGATYSRALLPLSDQSTLTPLIQISRRISPVATLNLSFGQQITRDRLNPSANNRSGVFNVTLSSPFTFGSGVVRGRSNPRLPATISGSVLKDYNASLAAGSAISAGLGNVTVVLDNRESQRTDLSGQFQFQFVKPGRHEVRVENASLPRGVTVDQPFASVELEGGQETQVFFRVGAYGGVEGHVYGRDASGSLTPLNAVALKIDDSGQNVVTSPYGAFGFGRLLAGTHVVKLIAQSLPANVAFSGDVSKTVVVRTGEIAPMEFIADPLGSIAGHVMFDAGLGAEHQGAVQNAYVVANPGDHAAITNEDGTFIIDNLPAGMYTVDLDPETLPEETGVTSGSIAVDLKATEQREGLNFSIGHKQKAVVFSLHQDETPATMTLSEPVLPPSGATQVKVVTPYAATKVTVAAFGRSISLEPDKAHRQWTGTIVVPGDVSAGPVEVAGEALGGKGAQASATLRVDNRMSIATFILDPARPEKGQYVRVRARFLADVKPGDTIVWQDGSRTRLGRPIRGRLFEFTIKVNFFPYRGFILIGGSKLPIILR
ncbi:MAG: hypothetical protein NVSMB31_15240 [Vulcanimicrobiaceae bacterium]